MGKRQTNIQLVKAIMNEHPLNQMFIVDAITKLADAVTSHTVEELAEAFGPHSLISPQAWHQVATNIKERFDKHLSS